jgi:uncharacterized protein YlaI
MSEACEDKPLKWMPLERTPVGTGVFFDWKKGHCPVCGKGFHKGKHQRTFHHVMNKETRRIVKAFRLGGIGIYVCRDCHRRIDNHQKKNVPLRCYADKPNICGRYAACEECQLLHRKRVDFMHDAILNGTCPALQGLT